MMVTKKFGEWISIDSSDLSNWDCPRSCFISTSSATLQVGNKMLRQKSATTSNCYNLPFRGRHFLLPVTALCFVATKQ